MQGLSWVHKIKIEQAKERLASAGRAVLPQQGGQKGIVQFRVRYDRWIKELKTHFLQP